MKKKLITLLTSAVMTNACMGWELTSIPDIVSEPMTADAVVYGDETQYGDYLSYRKVDKDSDGKFDYVEITYCDNTAVEIEIPEKIDSLPVTKLNITNCESLESITLPGSITDIGKNAFFYCTNLTCINVSESNENYSSADGVLFNKDKTQLIKYPIGRKNPEYSMPDSVVNIDSGAFQRCTTLTSVTLSDTLDVIRPFAFNGCTALTEIVIPDSVTMVGSGAFESCTSLTKAVIGKSVKRIGTWAFSGDENLSEISVPDTISDIGNFAFYNTAWLSEQKKNNPVVVLGKVLIDAADCKGELVIPEGVEVIQANAFYLESILVEPEEDENDDSGIGIIEFPTYVEAHTDITSISIPASLKKIESGAFQNHMKNLKSFNVNEQNPKYKSVNGILLSKDGTTLYHYPENNETFVIPDTVTVINSGKFAGYENLKEIVIPDSVTAIGNGAFQNCTNLTKVTLSDSLERIVMNAFAGCTSLEEITIPDSVTEIGEQTNIIEDECGGGGGVFSGCTSLKSVKLSDNLTRIESHTFYGCTSLESIDIPDSVEYIAADAFENTALLDNQTEPVKYADNWVIKIADKTTSAEIKPGTVGIADTVYTYSGYYDSDLGEWVKTDLLTSLVIPESVKHISDFGNVSALTDINISAELADKDAFAFISSPWAENYYTTETLENGMVIRNNILINGTACKGDVEVPEGVTRILPGAFMDGANWQGTDITSIKLPDSIKILDNNIFTGCHSMKTFELPEHLEYLGRIFGYYMITGTTTGGDAIDMDELVLPETLKHIEPLALDVNIRSITVPGSIIYTSRAEGLNAGGNMMASFDCENLIFSEGVEEILEYSVQDFSLKKVFIPRSLNAVCFSAFAGSSELTDIYYAGTEEEWNQIGIDGSGTGPFHNEYFLSAKVHFNSTPEDMNSSESTEEFISGDISGNGKIDLYDAIEICKSIMGMRTFTDEEKLIAELQALRKNFCKIINCNKKRY
ncbi:MAG: leucine-rich repeat domain-containing protein [Oscillospiraceae bacterium]|nr:leucine-rich repeat domain-containing protein [Oscillospiraceae bacterium]